MKKEKRKLKLSSRFLITALFLCLLGILTSYSASALKSNDLFGTPYYFVSKQIAGVFLGFSIIFALQKIPFRFLERIPLPMFCATSFLLLLIYIPGIYYKAGGAYRWISLAGFTIQPAELAKLSLIFLLAKNISRKSFSIRNFQSVYLSHGLILLFLAACLMKQPDFGSTFVLFLLMFLMLFVSGLKRNHLFVGTLFTLPAVVWAIWSAPYRVKRILSFLSPWENAETGGFQIIQSYLAFSNGGLLGSGFGASKQKLFYLPEAHTDFILPVLAEELGVLGLLFTLLLFIYLIALGFSITQLCERAYDKLLCFGLTSLLALQASLNIGVVLGLLPTKGSSLPFISNGVSFLVTCLLCVGVIYRIAREQERNHYDT